MSVPGPSERTFGIFEVRLLSVLASKARCLHKFARVFHRKKRFRDEASGGFYPFDGLVNEVLMGPVIHIRALLLDKAMKERPAGLIGLDGPLGCIPTLTQNLLNGIVEKGPRNFTDRQTGRDSVAWCTYGAVQGHRRQATMQRSEPSGLEQDAFRHICPYCRHRNVLPGIVSTFGYMCRRCGDFVRVKDGKLVWNDERDEPGMVSASVSIRSYRDSASTDLRRRP